MWTNEFDTCSLTRFPHLGEVIRVPRSARRGNKGSSGGWLTPTPRKDREKSVLVHNPDYSRGRRADVKPRRVRREESVHPRIL
jgi:hypothetical protein